MKETLWTLRIMRTRYYEGELRTVYLHVLSSTQSGVVGSIEFHGPETSSLLALLQMSSGVTVIDCSSPRYSSNASRA